MRNQRPLVCKQSLASVGDTHKFLGQLVRLGMITALQRGVLLQFFCWRDCPTTRLIWSSGKAAIVTSFLHQPKDSLPSGGSRVCSGDFLACLLTKGQSVIQASLTFIVCGFISVSDLKEKKDYWHNFLGILNLSVY